MNFQIASGSVIGKDHISNGKCLIGRNNQDAYAVYESPDLTVAIINDGCGSGKHSEVGAWIATNALTSSIVTHYRNNPNSTHPAAILPRVRQDVLAHIRIMANAFGGSFSQTINDYFLFTTVGILMTPEVTQIFAIGDGVYALKSVFKCEKSIFKVGPCLQILGPFPGNAPPYLAYDLVDSSIDSELLTFRIVESVSTDLLDAVLIGSDGAEDFDHIHDQKIPGSKADVGPIWQFWEDDIYFANPDAVSRRLRRCNSEVKRVDPETGRIVTHHRLLPDDTTLISIRRKLDW